MVYLLGNEYQHLHDSCGHYCLNIGTSNGFLIMKKEGADSYTLYANDGGEERPLITAPSKEICKEIIENIMLKHVTMEPHKVIEVQDLYPKEDERTGEEILTDMCQTLIDLGYEDLVDEFDATMSEGYCSININRVSENLDFGDENGLQAEETQTEKVNEEERYESPQEV
jgi:hypothetical protein